MIVKISVKHLFSIISFCMCLFYTGFSQSISINTSGAIPDSSAMLDIISNNKGLLIPRISLTSNTDDTTIVNPAVSLLVYNINPTMINGALGFWYWNGIQWIQAIGPAGATGPAGDTGNTGSTGLAGATGINGSTGATGATGDSFWTRTSGLISPVTTTDSVLIGKLYGSTGSNGDITINGTTNATKTSSYVNLQTAGGKVGIGTPTPAYELDINGFTRTKSIKEVSKQGLILEYNFNSETITGSAGSERVLDASTYNNHGSNAGATFSNSGGFDSSGVLLFDGLNDRVQCPSKVFAGTEKWTFSSWTYWHGSSDVFTFYAGRGATTENILLRVSSGNTFAFRNASGYTIWSAGSSASIINTWTLLTWAYDGNGHLSLYVNGELLESAKNIGSNTMTFNYIGMGYSGQYFFEGKLDDIRLYNRELSADEAKQLYLQHSEAKNSYVSQKNVYINNSGNVGIGTIVPQAKLSIVDTLLNTKMQIARALSTPISGTGGLSNSNYLQLGGYETGVGSYRLIGFGFNTDVSNNGARSPAFMGYQETELGSYTKGDLVFFTRPTSTNVVPSERMRIMSSGNVGIGTTSPGAKLDVTGGAIYVNAAAGGTGIGLRSTAVGSNKMAIYWNDLDAGTERWRIINDQNADQTDDLRFLSNNAATTVMTLLQSGNVGIGTTTPSQKLHVVGNTLLVTPSGNSRGFEMISQGGDYNKFNCVFQGGSGEVAAPTVIFEDNRNSMTLSQPFFKIVRTGAMVNGNVFEVRNTSSTIGLVVANSGNVGIGTTSPTATLHLKAGTSSANTAPLKYSSGTLLTTIETGAKEYNNAFYATNNASNRYGEGGVIFDNYTDAGNSGTSKTDLYSYTTKANTLSANGEKIEVQYAGKMDSTSTPTRQITLAFAGTDIFDTGAISTSANLSWEISATIIRVDATTIRYRISFLLQSSAMSPKLPIVSVGELTGLVLSNTNTIKITGTAAGTGAGTNNIVARLATGKWYAAANN